MRQHAAAGAIVAVLTLGACAQAEQPVLEQFFGLSRLRDRTALKHVASVIFEPHQDGIVRGFRIVSVSGERRDESLVSKDVTVDASVVMPDGRTVQKLLVVTLQRSEPAGARPWSVIAFRDAGASRSAPRP